MAGQGREGRWVTNYQAAVPGASYFIDFDIATTEQVTAQRVADKTMEVVEKHGFEQKAAAYVTDTCAVMKAAWVILERKMPLLMCFGCQAHVWSLFMKDICDLSEVKECIDSGRDVVKYFKNKTVVHSLLDKARQHVKGSIGLAMPVVTRWGSVNRMMHSLEENEASLRLAVSYPEFPGNPDSRVSAAERTRGREMRRVIDDPMFWDVVKGIRAFTQPPADLIYALESDSAGLGKAYYAIREMKELVAGALENAGLAAHADEIQGKFEERLEYGFHRVFILAALLDPALYPHVNSISMEERVQAEDLVMQFFPSRPFGNAAVAQLKAYREGKHGIPEYAFENPALVADAVGFWRDYGSENSALKHIARVAIRVLGIPPTAAGSERGWSTFRRVWSDDRNRLLSGRVALLVYCHYNQRVLDRTYKTWACTDWDSFIDALEQEQAIKAPEGHVALDVPGVEPLSDEEGDVVECDGGESEQENETPVNDAVAAEEAMMERDAIGPYRVVL